MGTLSPTVRGCSFCDEDLKDKINIAITHIKVLVFILSINFIGLKRGSYRNVRMSVYVLVNTINPYSGFLSLHAYSIAIIAQ